MAAMNRAQTQHALMQMKANSATITAYTQAVPSEPVVEDSSFCFEGIF